jgi:hypothetical protein
VLQSSPQNYVGLDVSKLSINVALLRPNGTGSDEVTPPHGTSEGCPHMAAPARGHDRPARLVGGAVGRPRREGAGPRGSAQGRAEARGLAVGTTRARGRPRAAGSRVRCPHP